MTWLVWIAAVPLGLLALAYLLLPVLIKSQGKYFANSRLSRIGAGDLESPAVTLYFAELATALEPAGFEYVGLAEMPMPDQRGLRMALFRRSDGPEIAVGTAMPAPTNPLALGTQRLSFMTPVFDGPPLETFTDAKVMGASFPETAKRKQRLEDSVFPFHGTLDPAQLFEVHRALVRKHIGRRRPRLLDPGTEIAALEAMIQEDDAERPDSYFGEADAEGIIRASWLGAYLMTWKLLWPIGGMRRRAAIRERARYAKRNLAAAGMKMPEAWQRTDPDEVETRLPQGHPLRAALVALTAEDDEHDEMDDMDEEARIEEIVARENAIRDHVARHVGPPQEEVFADIVPGVVRVAVNFVPPGDGRPYWFLFTTGMSSLPMPVRGDAPALAEVVMALPPDWPLEGEAAQEERAYWPVRWLRKLARLPHEMQVAVGPGITIPNGDPAEPFADGTELCCMLLASPKLPAPGFELLELPDGTRLRFLALVPLFPSEVDAKLDMGPGAFLARLEETGLTELLDPTRRPLT